MRRPWAYRIHSRRTARHLTPPAWGALDVQPRHTPQTALRAGSKEVVRRSTGGEELMEVARPGVSDLCHIRSTDLDCLICADREGLRVIRRLLEAVRDRGPPSTLHPPPSTFHPPLHFQPSTLNPQPSTLRASPPSARAGPGCRGTAPSWSPPTFRIQKGVD